jgi:predicted transposase YbfD/YdcC
LALKKNHKNLYDDVSLIFQDEDFVRNASMHLVEKSGYGRKERQTFYVISELGWLDCKADWKDLKTIIQVKSERTENGKTSTEMRYYMSSLQENAEYMSKQIRKYWGIENKFHWVLDVIFKEDQRKLWNKNFARNEAVIRRIGFNLLQEFQKIKIEETGKKIALKSLRKVFMHDLDIASRIVHSFFNQICNAFS